MTAQKIQSLPSDLLAHAQICEAVLHLLSLFIGDREIGV